jgi:PD-(D/E)XK nuclease superfamily
VTAFNQSRIKMFRRCQRQYSFRYDSWKQWGEIPRTEMVPKTPKKALYKGTWLHALQEAHHRAWAVDSGFDPALVYPNGEIELWTEVHARFREEYDGLFEEEKEELGDLPGECFRLFRAYLRRWKDDRDRYRVASLHDGAPAIEFIVTARLPGGITQAPFKGRIDLVVEDLEYGGLWDWDAKWVRTVPIADERMMSPQAPMYTWAMRENGYDLRGFVFNYGRSKAPVIPRILRDGTITLRQRLDTDYATYLTLIKEQHGSAWREWATTYYIDKLRDLKGREKLYFDRQRIPVEPERVERALDEFLATIADIKSRNKVAPPRSYFYNCKFGCEYHDLCVGEFTGLDIEPLVKAKFQFEGERYGDRKDLLSD